MEEAAAHTSEFIIKHSVPIEHVPVTALILPAATPPTSSSPTLAPVPPAAGQSPALSSDENFNVDHDDTPL
jgi:hypothetical protein